MTTSSQPGDFFVAQVQTRFSDTDQLGHINNATLITYLEIGRLELFREVGADASQLILARVAMDFERQVMLGDEVEVRTRVTRFGRTSLTVEQWVMAGGERAARAEVVVVHFDYTTQRATPYPDTWRTTLKGLATA